MATNSIIDEIDAEISRLQRARALLTVLDKTTTTKTTAPKKRARRKLSAAARKKIADAQRKRWAAFKARKR